MGELGYSKITNILAALGLELKLKQASASRPTLEELARGTEGDGPDRRRSVGNTQTQRGCDCGHIKGVARLP